MEGVVEGDCWTLVSTPEYAVGEIDRVPMQDRKTGEFIPQVGSAILLLLCIFGTVAVATVSKLYHTFYFGLSLLLLCCVLQDKDYLTSDGGPVKTLLAAFEKALGTRLPPVIFFAGQRWGSAFPAPVEVSRDTPSRPVVEVIGIKYDASATLPLVGSDDQDPKQVSAGGAKQGGAPDDFVDGGELNLFYCGDFASNRSPGVEAAALSALHCAERIATRHAGMPTPLQ
jgi:hypothetical protein